MDGTTAGRGTEDEMRLITGWHEGRSIFGIVRDGAVVDLSASGRWPDLAAALADPAGLTPVGAPEIAETDVELALPIPNPRRILCVGLNYHDHRAESGARVTSEYPTFFTRYVSSLV